MKRILFVNGCPRPVSRTYELAQTVLGSLEGEIEECRLFEDQPSCLTWEGLQQRDQLVAARDYSHDIFRWARQFREADEIVMAVPYWDLMFPALVKNYLEAITVNGLTFVYGENGIPRGLCKAKRLIYVTTSGGPIFKNFGFDYVDALARTFYGIFETKCVKAEGLDIHGADVTAIMDKAKKAYLAE